MAAAPTLFDEQFKILLIGDSGVGKSSILLRFTEDAFDELPPTIGVDFKVKSMRVDGKQVKLTIWDTAGQERFRTLTSAYYRGAHGVVLVYDVTKRETFESLSCTWLKEVDAYCTRQEVVKMLVGNKVDKDGRAVSRGDGEAFARRASTLFVESSAKTTSGVKECFEELIRKILDTPALCSSDSSKRVNNLIGLDGETNASDSYSTCGGC
mmetsp:Transcript_6955/g.14419  ORF Transcript_6955/g.14419 Transcript_6955/m.14419 type:complete len:210 (+) Transcript_6955:1394-2023(+)